MKRHNILSYLAALLLLSPLPVHANPLDKIHFVKISEPEGKAVIKDIDGKLRMVGVGDVISAEEKGTDSTAAKKKKKQKTTEESLRVVEIAKDRVLLERMTKDGPEKIIVRLENGKQSIEIMSKAMPKPPVARIKQTSGKQQ